jgi:hypothetical protein
LLARASDYFAREDGQRPPIRITAGKFAPCRYRLGRECDLV